MKKKDLINLISLAAIHGSNALFPLLIFPYLFLVLDAKEFSVIVVTESIALYILAVCLYSFDISGVKDIVHCISKNDTHGLRRTYWTIFLVRMLLFASISCFSLVCCYVFFNSYFDQMLLWLMYPLGMILQANYFFQATESNVKLCVMVFFSRVLASILIYTNIDHTGMGLLSTSLIAGSFLLSGVMSFSYILYSMGAKWSYFKFGEIGSHLRGGIEIFIGNFSVALFRGSNILILSAVSNPIAVSGYSISEKVIKSLQALSRPMNELAFPKIVKDIGRFKGIKKPSTIVWQHTKYQIYIMLFLIPSVIGGLHLIIYFDVWTKLDGHIVNLITIMGLAIFFGICNFMYGSAGLNTLGFHRYYAVAIAASGTVALIVSIILSYLFSDIGAAVSFVFGEAALFSLFYMKYKKIGSKKYD